MQKKFYNFDVEISNILTAYVHISDNQAVSNDELSPRGGRGVPSSWNPVVRGRLECRCTNGFQEIGTPCRPSDSYSLLDRYYLII